MRSDRFIIVNLVSLFCTILLCTVGAVTCLLQRWPWVFFSASGILVIRSLSSEIRIGRGKALLLGCMEATPIANTLDEFRGIYQPHWEVPAITIMTGFRFFGLIPRFERWFPSPSPLLPTGAATRDGPWPRYIVHFRGVPTEVGHFGHKGGARRKVEIIEMLDSYEMPNPRSVWF